MGARLVLIVAAAVVAAGCGGGNLVISSPGLYLDVTSSPNNGNAGPGPNGQPLSAVISPGQSIEFDAQEPATWTVSVNGTTAPAGGTFTVNGLSITTSLVGAGRIVVSTSVLPGAAVLSVTLTLVAVAQADSRQAATVTLQVR